LTETLVLPPSRGNLYRSSGIADEQVTSPAPVIDQIHAAKAATGEVTMRWLRRISGIVWIFSWYTIYLEIFRWHHMTKSLRFNPPPPPPGTDIRPKAGAPLIAVCLGSVAAPLVFLAATIIGRIRVRPGETPP
jgi:hypothetical protein